MKAPQPCMTKRGQALFLRNVWCAPSDVLSGGEWPENWLPGLQSEPGGSGFRALGYFEQLFHISQYPMGHISGTCHFTTPFLSPPPDISTVPWCSQKEVPRPCSWKNGCYWPQEESQGTPILSNPGSNPSHFPSGCLLEASESFTCSKMVRRKTCTMYKYLAWQIIRLSHNLISSSLVFFIFYFFLAETLGGMNPRDMVTNPCGMASCIPHCGSLMH